MNTAKKLLQSFFGGAPRAPQNGKPQSRWLPAWANRWTSQAHENRREIARNTTRSGSPERAAAYETARSGVPVTKKRRAKK